jgi:D-hexose-6-phosphate mutarotase
MKPFPRYLPSPAGRPGADCHRPSAGESLCGAAGAHLLSWKPAGEEEVLWLSNNTPFKQGVALRGGVPICWPWFGPSAQQGLPSHGFARNLPWTLKAMMKTTAA